jgi:hypothetical protein
MNQPEIKKSEVVIFKPKDGQTEFQVILDGEHDTVGDKRTFCPCINELGAM